ncbi:Ig-like domain-containing protein [Cronobacter turicensis]|nr:Ig-like domain-containing protein [Cronobacter turicensis]ELU8452877.1 Ig-like domain-containing protein [Cronobacter turicensis]ELY4109460.1 Ig-like domain-containing protein [Cronobacter turicensis]ELY4215756.1 Ig-like domain-containing protein [Cronobacter turicensis]EMA1789797.1 Ig-like domain-containing protein [Cronobacter turicensis]
MTITSSAGKSLIFYTSKNYAGASQFVTHGQTGELASASANWTYQSVAMSDMQAFVNSKVNSADASVVYLGHKEDIISVRQDDLTLLYPSSDQFPVNYLGIDPVIAATVWLDVDATQAAPNAVASSSEVGGSTTLINTLSLPGKPGALGFVWKSEGRAVVATCRYGDYNTSEGTVTWSGTGTMVLEFTGGSVVIISATGFPEYWTFNPPQLQGDGSWVVTLNGGTPVTNTIVSVTADPTSIVNDGISASLITAKVVDGNSQPVAGVSVSWVTTAGQLSVSSSSTDVNGLATTSLTNSGAPGVVTVTASVTGSGKAVDVTVTDSMADFVIASLTSDKDTINNDGVDAAKLTALVHDGQGNNAANIPVYWSTTLGSLNHIEQDTDTSGQSSAKLTDLGDTGKASVTASLGNGKSWTYNITIRNPAALNMYCSTGAPLNAGMLVAVGPTNKVALYGEPSAAVQLSVTGNARFTSGDTNSVSVTLDSSGYGLVEVYDSVAETVTVSTVISGSTTSGTMTFAGTSDKGAIYVNNLTPADNKTAATFYWWDYQSAGVTQVTLALTGGAHFADNSTTGTYSLNAKNGAVAVDIYCPTAATVSATLIPDSPYYVSSTEDMTFITYEPSV